LKNIPPEFKSTPSSERRQLDLAFLLAWNQLETYWHEGLYSALTYFEKTLEVFGLGEGGFLPQGYEFSEGTIFQMDNQSFNVATKNKTAVSAVQDALKLTTVVASLVRDPLSQNFIVSALAGWPVLPDQLKLRVDNKKYTPEVNRKLVDGARARALEWLGRMVGGESGRKIGVDFGWEDVVFSRNI
jgi:hypothetical protein